MSGLKIKQEWMQKTVVVWFGALLCCLLWGSAFPCIKIGYRLFEVDAVDTASQILFAGCRFTLAGILAAGIGSVMEGRFLRPERKAAKEIIWLSLLQTIIQYFFFLYGTCTYQWSKSFYYRSGECIYCDSGSRIFVSSGKDYIKKNHRLYSGICRSSID